MHFSLLAVPVLAVVATPTRSADAARSLTEYRYFRALSVDLAGRLPTRAELTAFEKDDFDLEAWILRVPTERDGTFCFTKVDGTLTAVDATMLNANTVVVKLGRVSLLQVVIQRPLSVRPSSLVTLSKSVGSSVMIPCTPSFHILRIVSSSFTVHTWTRIPSWL